MRRLLSDGDSEAELRYRTLEDLEVSVKLIRRILRPCTWNGSDESPEAIAFSPSRVDEVEAGSRLESLSTMKRTCDQDSLSVDHQKNLTCRSHQHYYLLKKIRKKKK
jgi:hypothetical protein